MPPGENATVGQAAQYLCIAAKDCRSAAELGAVLAKGTANAAFWVSSGTKPFRKGFAFYWCKISQFLGSVS
jgi:hypothetical protein